MSTAVPDIFPSALSFVLEHEGGLSNDPADPGGITRWGISLRWLIQAGRLDLDHDGLMDGDVDGDGDIDAADVRALPRERAAVLYRQHWWEKGEYDRIASPVVAAKTFDFAVNMGFGPAHRCLQRAARACRYAIADDGVIGEQTLGAVNAIDGAQLTAALKSEAAGFYRGLVVARPAFATFERGWLNRAYSHPQL